MLLTVERLPRDPARTILWFRRAEFDGTEVGCAAGEAIVHRGQHLAGVEAAAAKRMGLRFIGIELVPEYLDACIARLRQGVFDFGAPALAEAGA